MTIIVKFRVFHVFFLIKPFMYFVLLCLLTVNNLSLVNAWITAFLYQALSIHLKFDNNILYVLLLSIMRDNNFYQKSSRTSFIFREYILISKIKKAKTLTKNLVYIITFLMLFSNGIYRSIKWLFLLIGENLMEQNLN